MQDVRRRLRDLGSGAPETVAARKAKRPAPTKRTSIVSDEGTGKQKGKNSQDGDLCCDSAGQRGG